MVVTFHLRAGHVELRGKGKNKVLQIAEYDLILQLYAILPNMNSHNAGGFAKQVKPVRFVTNPKIVKPQIAIRVHNGAGVTEQSVTLTLANFTGEVGAFLEKRKTLALNGYTTLNQDFRARFQANWKRLTGN